MAAESLDILDQRDPVALPFVGSLLIHGGVLALVLFGWYWMNRHRETFGEVNPAGGPATTVSPVHNIPIPQREAPPNPVANDTQSTTPTVAAKQDAIRKEAAPDREAVPIPDRVRRQAERPERQQQFQQPTPSNQVFSRSQALSNPMYSPPTGGGQVGVGPNTPLGDNRLGWYAELIRQRIAQNWATNGLDPRSQMSPAMVSFEILRDGHVRSARVIQSSGNPNIDNTALRAVLQADGTLPPLPPQVRESSISAQFTFNLR
jgi:periplasmic protein TonB